MIFQAPQIALVLYYLGLCIFFVFEQFTRA